MTSATVRPASGAGGRHAEGRGYGLIIFASVLLLVIAFFNMEDYRKLNSKKYRPMAARKESRNVLSGRR